jgi:septum formation protein
MKLILASASPRRAQLMAQVGWEFTVRPVDIEEKLSPNLPPEEAVKELALGKALAASEKDGLIIGADTIVVLEDKILGKPHSTEEALDMLSSLSGKQHQVITGVAVVNPQTGQHWVDAEKTKVHFRILTKEEILQYIKTEEPMDKAGAYGIQGKGALLVQGIEGCYFNVVGLPLVRLASLLKDAGYIEVRS